jgi:CHAT domain-containing protein/Tfp pilus assembly protein PilF
MIEVLKLKYFFSSVLIIVLLSFFNLTYCSIIDINKSIHTKDILSIFRIAEKYQKEGNFEKALFQYKIAEKIAKQKSDKKKECEASLKIGLMLWNLGMLDDSLDQYNKALDIAIESNFDEKILFIINVKNIFKFYLEGKKLRSKGESINSINTFKQAIDLSSRIHSNEHKLKCLRQISLSFHAINNLDEFNKQNENALIIATSLNHEKEEANCLINIGSFYRKTNNYSKALYNYERALDIAKYLENAELESACLNNIGIIYKEIGNYKKSLIYLEKAYVIDQKLEIPRYIAIDLINLGETLRSKGLFSNNKENLNKALVYFYKCLDLVRNDSNFKIEVKVLNNIGTIESDLHNYSSALDIFQQAYQKSKKIQDIETMGMTLNNIGIVYYNLGNYEESSKYYEKAIILANQIKGGHILWETYLRKANTLKKQNNINEAIENYKKSINIIENIRSQITLGEFRASFLGTDKRIEAYHNLIDLYVRLDKKNTKKHIDNESFFYVEKAKARTFIDSLESSQIHLSKGTDFIIRNRENELLKDISNTYTQLLALDSDSKKVSLLQIKLNDLEDQLETLKREIRRKSPAYANLKYPKIITLKEAQNKLLSKNSAFFEYIIGENNCYAFVITKKDLTVFTIPSKEKLKSLVISHLKRVNDPDNNNFDTGFELYNKLIKPGLNKNIKKLIFVPDDILHYLPFETLILSKTKNQWLIEKYIISYTPSITAQREIISRRNAIKQKPRINFLGFGNPVFHAQKHRNIENKKLITSYSNNEFNFDSLKYSTTEIHKISSLFKENMKKIFIGENCTEENFKGQDLDNYKIIHFATHSLIDDKIPNRSTIVLSLDNDPQEDGFLQVREIYNLKMKCDLITLSSCQSGLGQLIKGEGIEGLNRAFFYLCSSKSIVNSLRSSKLELINSNNLSHPYYWAGFIISGKADIQIFKNPNLKLLIITFILFIGGFIMIKWIINNYLKKK